MWRVFAFLIYDLVLLNFDIFHLFQRFSTFDVALEKQYTEHWNLLLGHILAIQIGTILDYFLPIAEYQFHLNIRVATFTCFLLFSSFCRHLD